MKAQSFFLDSLEIESIVKLVKLKPSKNSYDGYNWHGFFPKVERIKETQHPRYWLRKILLSLTLVGNESYLGKRKCTAVLYKPLILIVAKSCIDYIDLKSYGQWILVILCLNEREWERESGSLVITEKAN